MIPPNENWLRSAILIESAIACGTGSAIISPGSRNTPLAHSAIMQNALDCHVNIDERSAAFTALGIAKATGKPVILICTSGTATANYYPAVVEANLSRIPLIIITSDRPAHLQNRGAPQTINQSNLYGSHVKSFLNVAEKIHSIQELDEFVKSIMGAFRPLRSQNIGPVHVNCPFDEPLQPIKIDSNKIRQRWDYALRVIAEKIPFDDRLNTKLERSSIKLIEQLSKLNDVCILAGPGAAQNLPEAHIFSDIIESINAPLFADIASGVRHLPNCINYPDLIHATKTMNKYNSGTIIWFGGYPTSKRLATWLAGAENVYRVQEYDQIIDPDHVVKGTIHTDIQSFSNLVMTSDVQFTGNRINDDLNSLDDKISMSMNHQYTSEKYPLDMYACATVLDVLPKGSNLVLANSMSIRYVDNFCSLNKEVRVFANKGVNGIDGTISTAAGVAIASKQPTVLIIGDLAFLHDINALVFVRDQGINLTIILLNNNGGGIFHYLPSYNSLREFDKLNNCKFDSFEAIQGTPQNVDFDLLCKGFGISYHACHVQSELSIVEECLIGNDVNVVEVFCDRTATHDYVNMLVDEIAKL